MFTGLLSAHDSTKNTPEVKAKKASEKMKTKYLLSDAQYPKVYAVYLDYYQKRAEMIGKDTSPTQKMEKRKALEAAKDTKLKAILTKEQNAKWSKEKSESDDDKSEKYKLKGKIKSKDNDDGGTEKSSSKNKGKSKSAKSDDEGTGDGDGTIRGDDGEHNKSDSAKRK